MSFITKIIIYLHIFIAVMCRVSRAKHGNSKKSIFCTSNDEFFPFWNNFEMDDAADVNALFSCVQPKIVMNTLLYSEKYFGRLTTPIFTRSHTIFSSFARLYAHYCALPFSSFCLLIRVHSLIWDRVINSSTWNWMRIFIFYDKKQ